VGREEGEDQGQGLTACVGVFLEQCRIKTPSNQEGRWNSLLPRRPSRRAVKLSMPYYIIPWSQDILKHAIPWRIPIFLCLLNSLRLSISSHTLNTLCIVSILILPESLLCCLSSRSHRLISITLCAQDQTALSKLICLYYVSSYGARVSGVEAVKSVG
jgi:hypothetical protein